MAKAPRRTRANAEDQRTRRQGELDAAAEKAADAVAAAREARVRMEAREADARAEVERARATAPVSEKIVEAREELASAVEEARAAEHDALLADRRFREADIADARTALREAKLAREDLDKKPEPGRDLKLARAAEGAARGRLDRLLTEKQRAVVEAQKKVIDARKKVAMARNAATPPRVQQRDKRTRIAEDAHSQVLQALEGAHAAERSAIRHEAQTNLAIHRGTLASAKMERRALTDSAAVLTENMRRAERAHGKGSNEYDDASGKLTKAQKELENARTAERGASGKVGETLPMSIAPDPADEIAQLSAQYPIVLFPVRIETRFAPTTAAGTELLVRIYPDEILAITHDPRLTRAEVVAGQTYWTIAWDPAREREAWSAIVTTFSPQRAAWIVSEMAPVNAEARAAPPEFPPRKADPTMVPVSYSQRVEADLLPDRWLVLCYRGGQEVRRAVSGTVRAPLALTVDGDAPESDLIDISGDGLRVDRDVLWTLNFSSAETAGMGVRVTGLTGADLEQGFDRVLVVGVKSSLTPDDGNVDLGELLSAHRYGRGLALVRQGTPTNNTGAVSAAYPPDDPAAVTYLREQLGAQALDEKSDGNRLLRALGVSEEMVGELAPHLAGAEGTEEMNSRAMNTALWPVTWGYALEQMMEPQFTREAIEDARQFFVANVRGRGPLPAFRIGSTPYGVLPVSSLKRWDARPRTTRTDAALPAVLRRLREIWLSAVAQVPRAGRTPNDPDKDLIEMLGLDASAREVRIRAAFGVDFHRNLFGLFGWPDPQWWHWTQVSWWKARAFLEKIGFPTWDTRILGVAFDERASCFIGPLVCAEPLSEELPLQHNYIDWLVAASVDDLRNTMVPPGTQAPAPLLYLLLRHAALVSYGGAALDLHQEDSPDPIDRVERELLDIVPGTEARMSVVDRLNASTGRLGRVPVKQFIRTAAGIASLPALGNYQIALKALSVLPTAELERLMTETLDVCSHRLDAWITSLASKRLAELRQRQESPGTHLGAFGWVEDLRRVRVTQRVPRTLAGGGTVSAQLDSGGYIQAPSLSHAAAAAVLRNAYLTRAGDARTRYAIDLSSGRVRSALGLLDAVRNGQPLSAVFGYLIERWLDDRRLQVYKEPLRQLYAMPGLVDAPLTGATDAIAARDVINGWKFYEAPDPLAELVIAPADRTALKEVVGQLREVADGVADLLTADAVYQIVSGGTASAASSLDALSKGARPPEPAVAHVPRGGTALTHRVAVALNAQAGAAVANWIATERASAEPALNEWAGRILGDPRIVQCRASYSAPQPGDPDRRLEMTVLLSQLGLAPLDVLAFALGAETEAAASELDRRVAYYVLSAAPEDSDVKILYDPDPSWDRSAVRTFPELLEVARTLNTLVSSARPMRPEDLVLPEGANAVKDSDRRLADAVARADNARQALDGTRTVLLTAQTDILSGATADLDVIRDALMATAEFGMAGAVPTSRKGSSAARESELLGQAKGVLRDVDKRLLQEAQQTDPGERISTLFGATVTLLPAFDIVGSGELANALADTQALVGDALEPVRWFQRAARVHPGVWRLRRVGLYANSLGTPLPSMEIVQLPYASGARWVALPFPSEDERPPSGRVSIALLRPNPRPLNVPQCGVVIAEWNEGIPNVAEQTGLGFHYDDPGAEAAQTVLIAVPPTNKETWDLDSLAGTLNETIDLAKIRCVDADLVGEAAQLIPAIYLAANAAGETIETDFADLRIADPEIVPVQML